MNKLVILTVCLFAGIKSDLPAVQIQGELNIEHEAGILEALGDNIREDAKLKLEDTENSTFLCIEKSVEELETNSEFLKGQYQEIQGNDKSAFFEINGNAQLESAMQVTKRFFSLGDLQNFVETYKIRLKDSVHKNPNYFFSRVLIRKCFYTVECRDDLGQRCNAYIVYFQEAGSQALDTFLRNNQQFDANDRWKGLIALQLAKAVKSAHDMGLFLKGYSFTDFSFREGKYFMAQGKIQVVPVTPLLFLFDNLTLFANPTTMGIVGSSYKAPEFAQRGERPPFSAQTDVHTLGTVIYALFNFKQWLNKDGQNKAYQILSCTMMSRSTYCSTYAPIVTKLQNADPAARGTIEEAIVALQAAFASLDATGMDQFAFDKVSSGGLNIGGMLKSMSSSSIKPEDEFKNVPFANMIAKIYPSDSPILNNFLDLKGEITEAQDLRIVI